MPAPKEQIPERLKADNWAFHVLARSDDPAIKCLNVGNLMRNIKSTIECADIEAYEYYDSYFKIQTTVGDFIDYQIFGANKAWNAYSQNRIGQAVEIANGVLEAILPIIYDDRFTTSQVNSFGGRKP
ncbi:MAG: hypothetical protein PHX61_02255 [Alphaproteobacteria bacterium]|nr:hypothetical protein [Alphaproteobacteria bacterium]